MTTFEPGRIYSVEQYGQRHLAIYRDSGMFVYASGGGGTGEVTDVRGPLVVLDLSMVRSYVPEMIECLDHNGFGAAAIQIEAQTRPPLQVGWHETESGMARYYDGTRFRTLPGGSRLPEDTYSVYYIGPANGDGDD